MFQNLFVKGTLASGFRNLKSAVQANQWNDEKKVLKLPTLSSVIDQAILQETADRETVEGCLQRATASLLSVSPNNTIVVNHMQPVL